MTKVYSNTFFANTFFSARALRVMGFVAFAAVAAPSVVVFAAGTATAGTATTKPGPRAVSSEYAEICQSSDGRFLALRGFGETTTTLVMRNPDPKGKPIVKQGFTCTKDPAGSTQKNPVAPEMFELMAESFGTTTKPKDQWKNTYEGRFDGKVAVTDDTGKKIGTMMMSCHSAIVEY